MLTGLDRVARAEDLHTAAAGGRTWADLGGVDPEDGGVLEDAVAEWAAGDDSLVCCRTSWEAEPDREDRKESED